MAFKEKMEQAQKKMADIKAKLADKAETAQIAGMLAKDELDKKMEELKSNATAATESARIVAERGKGKVNSELIKAQMNIAQAKAELEEKKEAHDKHSQENYIHDLIDYAESCQSLAAQLMAESDLAMLKAETESRAYNEKYGE